MDRQLSRLDVESGDTLIIRTRSKLQAETAARWQDELQELCRSKGCRDVIVIVLDDCTDLTVERPQQADTRMQHRAPAVAPQSMQG